MAYPTTLLDAPVSSKGHRRPRRRIPGPLAAILAAQAGLSLLLAASNTAFEDEALYLWAGHVELAQWFQGVSLAFMLATTCLLWSAAHRLSGRRAAVICCALWLACESNLRMGAYATYDPM